MEEITSSLSPIERKIVPYLNLTIEKIIEKSNLDKTSVLRALKFLENKSLVTLKSKKKTIINLGTNGIYYKKNHLPERKLLMLLESSNHLPIQEAKTASKLSDNEFKVSLGVLKSKAIIELKNGKISILAPKSELAKKFQEEQLIEILPIEKEKLSAEQQFAFNNLKSRKKIIELNESKEISFELTNKGEKIAGQKITSDFLEEVTPEIIQASSSVHSKRFRRYDIQAPVPSINGGKKHFVSQAIEYAKKVWTDLGFKEMTGPLIQTSFWNFDSLFTAQDHPVREMHDTFYIKNAQGKLPEKKLIDKIKKAHEQGVSGSKGWQYTWQEKESKRIVLRTHTTPISAQTLAKLKKEHLPKKYFAIGKCFRNETVDWSHGFEFNQTEGIVIDKGANFSHLLGYLEEFFKKMGFPKVKFTPAYFPYTEPSVEISALHPEKKVWLELGGAGIFRPEVTIPLLGENIPILAWGPGFDRILIDYYKIKDLRELYENDIKNLRKRGVWLK